MSIIEAARREWPALWWEARLSGRLWIGWADGRVICGLNYFRHATWYATKDHVPGYVTASTARAALRAARAAMPQHVEHRPRTPIEAARQDWPALRWTAERDGYGGLALRGHAGREVVVMATKWPGRGWLVSADGVPMVRAERLRDGLRHVRWALA